MSDIARVLARLATPKAVLASERRGKTFGVFPGGDRRRRPVARVDAECVRELESSGAIARAGDAYALTPAGFARARRSNAEFLDETFLIQHCDVVTRKIVDAKGREQSARGLRLHVGLKRLAGLRDGAGAPWLSDAELAAAAALRHDWDMAQCGLVRGSDWSAPPRSASARGPGRDDAMVRRCDARARMDKKLAALAPVLRRIVERACIYEEGIEALERAESWPARSGKVALKLGLAQLALLG